MRSTVVGCLVLGLITGTLHAQDISAEISDEEFLSRLLGQLESERERSRGLTIVTGQDQESSAASEQEDGLSNLADIKANTGTKVVSDASKKNRVGENLEINIQIQFEFDSAALTSSEQPALDQMCRVMKQAADVQLFQIVGHTDSSGSESYNQRLSQLRANEVKRYLTSDCGISETRLKAVGYGEEFPDNEANPRAAENRRVELQVLG